MTNSEQRRLTNWRLKVLQAATTARNVARTCRHFGISRKTFYKWHRRYREHGDAGLADRARAPHHSPQATFREVVGKILYLRQHYHFGPGKIASAALTEDRYRTPLASETAIEDRCWNQPAPNGEATTLTTLLRIRPTVVFSSAVEDSAFTVVDCPRQIRAITLSS